MRFKNCYIIIIIIIIIIIALISTPYACWGLKLG